MTSNHDIQASEARLQDMPAHKAGNLLIIAEAGVNHNGDLARARDMVWRAAEAGVDYVKFQTALPERLVAESAPMAEYQKRNTGKTESQRDMLRRLLLPFEDFVTLKEECARAGVGFMSTPFDIPSVEFLHQLGQDYIKIPSGEIDNLPYLRAVAACGTPVIISCGMSSMEQTSDALKILTGAHPLYPSESTLTLDDIILLHCNTQYPTPFADVNLRAMHTLHQELGVRTGYSDHTVGVAVPVAAAALGAVCIEKHFTLSRELPGPDHKASLEPSELALMVRLCREAREALGSPEKRVSESERANIAVARKSIVAACHIAEGEIFTPTNLDVKRPAGGISPMLWDSLIGTRATRAYLPDELIDTDTITS